MDAFIVNLEIWRPEAERLRSILLECQLQEELKWRQPCYTFQGKNVAIIAIFKEYCAISFLKGVLLKDTNKLLHSPGENSQTVRYIKFNSVEEIDKIESTIRAYIFEAIEVEKAGLKADFKKSTSLTFPPELLQKFEDSPDFKEAFTSLTPGRQRGYNLFFNAAKQSETRSARIEKHVQRIFDGKGIHDCVCGHSKRMPTCDGSHKFL